MVLSNQRQCPKTLTSPGLVSSQSLSYLGTDVIGGQQCCGHRSELSAEYKTQFSLRIKAGFSQGLNQSKDVSHISCRSYS